MSAAARQRAGRALMVATTNRNSAAVALAECIVAEDDVTRAGWPYYFAEYRTAAAAYRGAEQVCREAAA